jgi:hypothetical protein
MKNPLDKKQGIFIELDVLLDTRLATLYNLSEESMISALDNGYFTRRTDTFHGTDKEVFDEAYKNRDKETLKNAGITKMIGFIRELIHAMNKQAIEEPIHSGPKLYVNIYPYKLNEKEIEAIITATALATGEMCDIEVVDMPPERITPKFCKANLAIMFMYNYAPWLEAQAENFKATRCSEITVIVPGIYFNREPTKEELSRALNTYMHPLKAIEFVSAVFINLKLYEIDNFCLNAPGKNIKTS